MEAVMAEAHTSEVKDDQRSPKQGKISTAWRRRYAGSAAEDLFKRLGALDFGNWILIFGATLLLTILPIILLLSSLASLRVDDDLARHLDLSRPGSVVFDSLFKSAPVKFDSGFVLSLIIGVASSVGVAITVQILYERVFDQPHHKSLPNVVRCALWALVLAANLIADGAVSRELRGTPDRAVLSGAVAVVAGTPLLVDDALPLGRSGPLGAAIPIRGGHCGLLGRAGGVLALLLLLVDGLGQQALWVGWRGLRSRHLVHRHRRRPHAGSCGRCRAGRQAKPTATNWLTLRETP
jgi:hypothetical protein